MNIIKIYKMAELLQLCGRFNQLLLLLFSVKECFSFLLLLLKLQESCLLPLLYVVSLSKQIRFSEHLLYPEGFR